MTTRFFSVAILSIFLLSVFTTAAVAQKDKGKDLKKAVDQVNKASQVINEIMGIKDTSIPKDLLARAKAVVVFPAVVKERSSSVLRADEVLRFAESERAGPHRPF